MTKRAAATAQTRRNVLEAAFALWRERSLAEITLQDMAESAGVTVQTVLRHFGSKEGVIEAAIQEDIGDIRAHREQAPVGDLEQALEIVLQHYERDGAAVLRNLDVEARVEAARVVAASGREGHRSWCARVFAPYLPSPTSSQYAERLDGFVAATDLYLWKLLRLDNGRSLDQTRAALRALLDGLAQLPTQR